MKKFYYHCISTAIAVLLLAGCATDNTPPPTPLASNLPMRFTPTILWSTHATEGADGQFISLAPAISKNLIVTAGNRGDVVALDRSSGDKLWSVNFDAAFTSTPAIHNNTVYVGTLKGKLYAINLDNGKLRWRVQLPSSVFAKPVIDANTIVVHAHNDDVLAFNATSGKVMWHKPGSPPSLMLQGDSAPIIEGNTAFVGLSTGFLEAINLTTGKIKWDRPVSLPTGSSEVANIISISGQPAIKTPFIYAVSYQGNVAALNMDNGKSLWQHPLSSYKPIFATNDKLLISSADSKVYALDRETGKVLWVQKKLAYRFLSAPVLIGKNVVVADLAGYLHFLSIQDGHLTSRIKVASKGIRAKPIVRGNTIYVNTNDGHIVAIKV